MPATQLRIPDDLWRLIRIAAAATGQSANAWMLGAAREKLLRTGAGNPRGAVAAELNRTRE